MPPYGFTGSVRVRAFRETAEQAMRCGEPVYGPRWSVYYAVFPDGTRKRFMDVYANEELRGYHVAHGPHHYFGFEFKKRPLGDNVPINGLIMYMLENGQRFWRVTTPKWNQPQHRWDEIHEYVRFMYVRMAPGRLPVITIRRVSETPNGNHSETEELPVNKFLEAFNPNESFHATAQERAIMARKLTQGNFEYRPMGLPFPFAVSILTMLKAMLLFRRLHIQAQERKYAPGGLGHKRAMEGATAKAMPKKPATNSLFVMKVQPLFAVLLPQSDGSYTGTFRFQNRCDREAEGPREEGVEDV